ncbi:MAG TPA: transglycosylase domain-containing protein [Anaerolineales bacterium]|nr:transglycosylase domain-containing protein [Anaerolineales bacterium]
MPSAVDIVRRREKNRGRRAGSYAPRARAGFLSLFSALSVVLGIAGLALAVTYNGLTADLPSLQVLPGLLDPQTGSLAAPTEIYDRTGAVTLTTLGARAPTGAYLSLRQDGLAAPLPVLADAVIAAGDTDFWSHPGIRTSDWFAAEPDTIPWKLVSALLFWDETPGLRRTLREKLLATQIVAEFGREQVLEWYLNAADFGHGAFGAEAAARLYFGRSASALDLAEAAALAAISQAPHLNPFDTPELARVRRDEVLAKMQALGDITAEEAAAAQAEPLAGRGEPPAEVTAETAFIEAVLAELAPHIPRDVLMRGGLRVYTTLDAGLQAEAACALTVQLERLAGGAPEIPTGCTSARLLPSLTGRTEPGSGLAAETAVIDPRSGQVLAFAAFSLEGGAQASPGAHPPGSLLTPYVYLSAFTRGLSPGSLVWDIPTRLPDGGSASPNLDGTFHGPVRIRIALASDYLAPAAGLLAQIGPAAVWETASLSGLPSIAGETGPLIFEGGAVPLLESVHAFGALSTQGVLIGYEDPASPLDPVPLRASTVLRVEDLGGRTWYEPGPPQARPVMSAPLAYALVDILSDETARWPALGHPNALEIGRPAGVKTGFTQNGRDAWTVGFTSGLAVGVWVGFDPAGTDPEAEGAVDPGAAAGLWHGLVKFAAADLPSDGWSQPVGIVEVEVCDPSGQLPTADCPVIVREIFLQGSEPVQTDTLYRRFEINRETGLLATVFTPPGLIEERVYLVPPPEALVWAVEAGYAVPPENYDLVSQPPPASPNARLESPAMFAYIAGELAIVGSAGGPGFQSYSVQVGQGLNPQQWLQLGESSGTQVASGELARWDTAGLSGLYAVRLLVVREDNRVETHVIQVTVDNQPPDLAILYPADGQSFDDPEDASVTVQLSVSDNVLLARVDVYLDDSLVASLAQPPYALALDLAPGEHTLRVEAVDTAGNVSSTEHTLTVAR